MIIRPRQLLTVAITDRPVGLSASDYADVAQAVYRLPGTWSVWPAPPRSVPPIM